MGLAIGLGKGRGATTMAPQPRKKPTYGSQSRQNDFTKQLQSVWDLGRIAAGPSEQAINNNITSYMQQLGLTKANQQMQTGYINQDQATGMERLGLNREGLGIQRGALQRQEALSPQQHALEMEALNQRDREAWFGAGKAQRGLSSQATTAGSLQSQGAREGFSDIQQQLEFGLKDIGRAKQGEEMQFKERQAGIADQKKSLDLAAKGLDIDGRELQTRTQRALQELGLSSALSVQDVTRAINDLNAGRYNPLQAILGTIYQASGVRPVAQGGR